MPSDSIGGALVPDSHSSRGGGKAVLQDTMEMKMLEVQALQSYNPPGAGRKAPEVEWVRNTLDGSILHDHKGYPVSVNRLLATKPLRAELSSRPGPGGKKLTYLSGEGVTRTLNEVFGFDGWDLSIVKTQREECVRDDKGRFHVAYTSVVRLTHKKSGTFKEDVGASDSIDRIMGTAVAHALKGSITDALKRAARHFGEKLGNTLYQGDFSISKAPLTLQEALDQYDNERAATKFGPSTTKIPTKAAVGRGQENTPPHEIAQSMPKMKPGVDVRAPANKTVSISKESMSTSTCKTGRSGIDNQPHAGGGYNAHSSMPQAAKTPSSSTAPGRPVVSATPAANKFRNSNDSKIVSNPPKLHLPTACHNLPRNSIGVPSAPPPLSSVERLRSQSSMFSGGSIMGNFGSSEENTAHAQNGPCQSTGTLVRPATSSGRKSDHGVVDWSRHSTGGSKRTASMVGAPMGAQVGNKRLNSNPYANK